MGFFDRFKHQDRSFKGIIMIISVLVISLIIPFGMTGCKAKDMPEFSDETMFTLKVSEPWIYESLGYTLKSDGTLIVLYRGNELGREQLSDERMSEIRKFFSPGKVYSMNVGKEDDMTDGTSRYIILYDSNENEITIGGYELRGGDRFNSYFAKLYALCEDDYTKQFSDLLLECMSEGTTYQEKYLDQTST
jgi:hypothetical protein